MKKSKRYRETKLKKKEEGKPYNNLFLKTKKASPNKQLLHKPNRDPHSTLLLLHFCTCTVRGGEFLFI